MRVIATIGSVAVIAALAAIPAGGAPQTSRTPATQPMRTAVYINGGIPAQPDLYMKKIRSAGAWAVRLTLVWADVAPKKRPSGFDPSNPADPAYNWRTPDNLISAARAQGLEPLVTIYVAPKWAGRLRVSPTQLGKFARAAARRYSGSFRGLPRVRYWLVWNEPNLHKYVAPQYVHHRLVSASRYRKMVNAMAGAVHGVHPDNVVVAGELAPLDTPTGPGAMKFTRAALCISAKLHSTCKTRLHFDIWSTHPYTSGGPTHKAHGADGVSLGNVPTLAKLVRAAAKHHHIVSRGHVGVWTTEFSWDSRPPDPMGVPAHLEARWTAEALYRLWNAHVGLLTWLVLVDRPRPLQAGLYYRGRDLTRAQPKPVLSAFRFPFVALKGSCRTHPGKRCESHGSHVYVWGRTPDSRAHWISIQKKSRGHGWSGVATVRANAKGIFFRTLNLPHSKSSWSMRARIKGASTHSPGFSLHYVPDHYYRSFS